METSVVINRPVNYGRIISSKFGISEEQRKKNDAFDQIRAAARRKTMTSSEQTSNGVQTSLHNRTEVLIYWSAVPAVMQYLYGLNKFKLFAFTGRLPSKWVHIVMVCADERTRDIAAHNSEVISMNATGKSILRLDTEEWHYKCDICFNWFDPNQEYDEWHYTENCVCCLFCFEKDHFMYSCTEALNLGITSFIKRPKPLGPLNVDTLKRSVRFVDTVWRSPSFNCGPDPYYYVYLPNDYDEFGRKIKRFVASMAVSRCPGINGNMRGTEVVIHVKTEFYDIQVDYHEFVNDIDNIISNQTDNCFTSIVQMERGKDREIVKQQVLNRLRNRFLIFNNKKLSLDLLGITNEDLRNHNIRGLDLALVFNEYTTISDYDKTVTVEELTLLITGKVLNDVLRDGFSGGIICSNGEPFKPRIFSIAKESKYTFRNFVHINELDLLGQQFNNLTLKHVNAWVEIELNQRLCRKKGGKPFAKRFVYRIMVMFRKHSFEPNKARIEKIAKRHFFCKTQSV